jgi:type II secretory pathway pseudopilin PulG
MLHLGIKAIVAIIAGLTAAAVVTIVVIRITRAEIINRAREANKNAVTARIADRLESGDFAKVNIGLFDDRDNRLGSLEIKGQEMSSDVQEGLVLQLKS